MSFVKNTLSRMAQTISVLLVWGDSLRSRKSGNNPYQSLRRDLCETGRGRPGKMLALLAHRPVASGAPSQALRNGFEDRKASAFASATYPATPEILTPHSVETAISTGGFSEEPSAPLTWTELPTMSLTGPIHLPSTTDGIQITRQSKWPPSRQSLRRTQPQSEWQRQSPRKSIEQQRKQQRELSQPQPQWFVPV